MKKLLALFLVFVMVFAMAACGTTEPAGTTNNTETTDSANNEATGDTEATEPVDPEAAKYGGHLNFVISGKASNLDPAKSTGIFHYMWTNLIWESPLTKDTNGKICPNVCDFELSEDQLTLKLWVLEGKTFHDGSAVEIEDVVASIQRAVHKNPRAAVAEYITSVEIDDKGVATIVFKEYNEKTMNYVAGVTPLLGVMPKEICEKYSYESGEIINSVEDAIGTGPYKVTDYKTEEYITLERFDGYVAVEEGNTGMASPKKAYLDTLTFWSKTDENAFSIGLINGEYDLMESVSEDYYAQMENAGIVTENYESTASCGLIFNTYGNSVTSNDVNLRKAIVAAIDIPELIAVALQGYEAKGSWVTDAIYAVDDFTTVDYYGADNVELAKQYLAASNYNGEEIQVVTSSGYTDIFTMISSYLEAAGIKINVQIVEGTAAKEFVADPNNNWDFYFDYPTRTASPTLLAAKIMSTDYKSEAKDKLVGELSTMIAGSDEYIAKWHELAAQMVDDCATVYFGQGSLIWSMPEDLNFEMEGLNPYLFNTYWTNPAEHTK